MPGSSIFHRSTRPPRMWRARALLAGAAASLAGGLAGCGDAAPASAPERTGAGAVQVRLAPVERRPVDRTVEITGTLFGEEEVTLSSKVGGRIARIHVDLGDEVAPGEALAEVDPTDLELALAERRAGVQASLARLGLTEAPPESFDLASVPTVRRARAEEANARARYERARQLFDQTPPLISAQDFADIETQWEVARGSADVELLTAGAVLAEARTQAAAVAISEQRLSDTVLRTPSPQTGAELRYRVAARLVSVGEMVGANQPAFRLVASERIKFRGAAPERYVGRIERGQSASIFIEAFRAPFSARVTRISPQVSQATRSFEVEIEAGNQDGRLRPGAFARARVVFATEPDVCFVPAGAVATFAGVEKVFSVAEGRAVEHRVATGVRIGEMVEIVGGIDASHVVAGGASGLSAGAPVTVAREAAGAE